MTQFRRFEGAAKYIADESLLSAVNAAIALERPLLVKGEPGTGKTMLAQAIAESLGRPLFTWHVKSTSKAIEGLYTYDVVQRLNDSRFGDQDVSDIRQYIKYGPLARALMSAQPVVLLIDEVDKADLEFPNDLLRELDEMTFYVPEIDETIRAVHRPMVLITSNAEKELPDAFLRRCVFHYLEFPDRDRLKKIVGVHQPDLEARLVEVAMERFYRLRSVDGIRKKPSTSELLDWLLVLSRAGVRPEQLESAFPFSGVLVKQEQDRELVERVRAKTGLKF
ncbi:MAG: MoxR family ATPase [Deltaproteobacteria bacterium]|nr:MoxR family ATPase [Deltaproteobacteria bacterium]